MTVKQIENVLALLEFFAKRQKPATLADVTSYFGWPRSSAFNILSTLAESGYLFEPKARGGYYPTPRWNQVVSAIAEGEPLPEQLRVILRNLASRTGETVWISAPSGAFAVFLDVVESDAPIRYAATPGKRVPIHVTASGQALLSQMTERDREVLLRKATFGGYGPNAARSVEEVRTQMAEGCARGWFYSSSFYSRDLGGVSVPVVIGDRVYAVTVAGPIFRVKDKSAKHAALIYQAVADELGADHTGETLKDIQTM